MRLFARFWKVCLAAILSIALVGVSAGSVSAAPRTNPAQKQALIQKLQKQVNQLNSQKARLQKQRATQQQYRELQELNRRIAELVRQMHSIR